VLVTTTTATPTVIEELIQQAVEAHKFVKH
jgi:hypothetical protein